jgi:glycosyltransferase involved in cell wall biosynthesis
MKRHDVRVTMFPQNISGEESGIVRVMRAYEKYLPDYGVKLVSPEEEHDLKAIHAGSLDEFKPDEVIVAHLHGLYWTADYNAPKFEYRTNQKVINSMIHAKEMIVPSAWVNEAIQRDMRRSAHVIPHGIDWEEWEPEDSQGYVLWNKNRPQDVCTPQAVSQLALKSPHTNFVTTFTTEQRSNVKVVGVLPHVQMKTLVQQCGVYLVTSKETFCIGALEAMASSKPVLYYAYGNVPNLVPHGVAGYGARPGDEEDLLNGLNYCLKYGKTLGDNGRELVKQYTWAKVCEQVAEVYRQALKPQGQTVSIIIPCYNKAGLVSRAIDSALVQTHPCEIIVVDDGSTDGSWREIKKYGDYIHSYRTDNYGVTATRNTGLAKSIGHYIVCLDADDALSDTYVETMLRYLGQDQSLGAVYSRIMNVYPDGRKELSPWPREWNYDQHLAGINQVPTCCLMRRDMVTALGGYREAYAQGKKCGFEDSDLFLRMGAYGWRAKLVTEEPLFLYSSGVQITGSPKSEIAQMQRDEQAYYQQNYLWYTTGQHPFASAATPSLMSHPVRQYDEPLVTVEVTGQEDLALTLNSLEAQTEHRWEVIATPLTGYPYVRSGPPRGPFTLQMTSGDTINPMFLEQALRVYSDTSMGIVVKDGETCITLRPTNWTGDNYCLLTSPQTLFTTKRGTMGCYNCNRQVSVTGKVSNLMVKATALELNDKDYQWVRWDDTQAEVKGPQTKTRYGVKSQGERFLCNVSDIKALGNKVVLDDIKRPVTPIPTTPPPKKVKV